MNSAFFVCNDSFYPIGMGAMTDGLSVISQRRMMKDRRVLCKANEVMKKIVEENHSFVYSIVSDCGKDIVFKLACRDGSEIEAVANEGLLRLVYNSRSKKVFLYHGYLLVSIM